jgi:hypothetical protein
MQAPACALSLLVLLLVLRLRRRLLLVLRLVVEAATTWPSLGRSPPFAFFILLS